MKRTWIVLGSSMLTVLLIIGGYFGMKYFQKMKANQKLLSEIKSHYSENVMVKGKLYLKKGKQFESCGAIDQLYLSLAPHEIKSIENQYFQIADTNYYVFYLDVVATEKREISVPNYIVFNQNIRTKEITHLYQEGNLVLTIHQEMDFPILYRDDENYYVHYMSQVFAIPLSEKLEVYEYQNTDEHVASEIPVIYYDDISTFKDTANWQEQVQMLKEKSFHSISLSDYEKWLYGNIRVKDNAVLLLSKSEVQLDGYQVYNKDDSLLTFRATNAVSSLSKAYLYQVKDTTTKEQFMLMLAGEPVITSSKEQRVAVLNYHFFYNPDAQEGCNENICLATSKFEEQLSYLKNNGYYTLTMEEFRDWMYGRMEVPEKSVLLTIDDGAMGTGKHNGNKLIPLLEKYNLHATLFLITGWWDIENYRSSNLDVESHTNDMHTMYANGAQMLNSSYNHVIEDLNQSIAITGSKKAFCFPFYAYNDTAIAQVKEVGFELSFVGGNYKASRNNDKYKIPRYPIYKGITMQQFINMIS